MNMKIKGHSLGAWFNYLLFKLLPPEWYLRTQGIKLPDEPYIWITVTYRLHGQAKMARVRSKIPQTITCMIPLWFKCGFLEPVQPDDEARYRIPPEAILKVEWYDPILEESFSIWRGDDVENAS